MTVSAPRKRPEATVIVGDSDVLERLVVAAYLRDCGFRVIEAADSDEVMAILGEDDIEADVVLADASIEGSLSGFKLATWIRGRRTEVHVVLAASLASTAQAAANLCEEGPLMTKPYDPQLVVDRIRRLIAERGRRNTRERQPISPALV